MMLLGMILQYNHYQSSTNRVRVQKAYIAQTYQRRKNLRELHVLLNCPEVQPFLDYFVSQYGHDQVFPSFITWYTNWVMDAELEMNLEHPDHILEEVNKEELDMPTNMEDDEETLKRMNG
ncbi:hypothetical protein H5410_027064 [Solanum commersonii]|uniref:Uncharacterized protein n=1 Tax=Solanum commersonii TaxID=4109 RepID=A0A9J5Z2D4_SOLCO|nr:hypothetical protein H5410_027064 [Solanum commersonii]